MWDVSYKMDDCEVDKVMDGLKIDREAANKYEMTKLQIEQCKQRLRAAEKIPAHSKFHAKEKTITEEGDISRAVEGEEESDESEAEE